MATENNHAALNSRMRISVNRRERSSAWRRRHRRRGNAAMWREMTKQYRGPDALLMGPEAISCEANGGGETQLAVSTHVMPAFIALSRLLVAAGRIAYRRARRRRPARRGGSALVWHAAARNMSCSRDVGQNGVMVAGVMSARAGNSSSMAAAAVTHRRATLSPASANWHGA